MAQTKDPLPGRRPPRDDTPASAVTASATLSFGEKLKHERESRHTDLREVVRATEIGAGYLEALENNDFDKLPGPSFGKLYIRSYAKVVGFDPEPLIADYDRERFARMRQQAEQAENAVEAEPMEPAEPAETVESIEPVEETAELEPDIVAAEAAVEVAPAALAPLREAPLEQAELQPRPVDSAQATGDTQRELPRALWIATLSAAAILLIAVAVYLVFFRAEDAEPAFPTSTAEIKGTIEEPTQPAASARPEEEQGRLASAQVAPASTSPTRLAVPEFGVGRRIVNRRLVDPAERFEEGSVAWFSSRVTGGSAGEIIRHVWLHNGRPMQSIELELGGPHWRTHSNKTLWGTGEWAVEVHDAKGRVLARADFSCVGAR